jgi:formylmethanofuran dehydrogenase subunit C
MSGGLGLVHGSAGAHAGVRLRRGLVAVAGVLGPWAGAHMVAGTLIALGPVGDGAGVGLKRGTIVAADALSLLPTFRYACRYRPGFLELTLRELAAHGFDASRLARGSFERYNGDFADLGKGEILKWTA